MPKEFLCDLPGNVYPLRTRNGTLTLLARAEECTTKAEAYRVLLEQSVRNIPVSSFYSEKDLSEFQFQNTLLNHFSHWMCVYQSFCSDPLHQIEQGIWGQHCWKWFKEVYLSVSELRCLDEMCVFSPVMLYILMGCRFQNLPRFPGIHHFTNGVSALQSITADEQSTILHVRCVAID